VCAAGGFPGCLWLEGSLKNRPADMGGRNCGALLACRQTGRGV